MKRLSTERLAVLLLLSMFGFCAAAHAAVTDKDESTSEEKKQSPYARAITKKASRSEADPPPRVYTNDDLETLGQADENSDETKAPLTNEDLPAAPLPRRAVPSDATRRVNPDPGQRIARARDLERAHAAKQAQLLLAEQEVEILERRLLQIKNPFLARPVVPEEQKAEWEKLDGAGRASLTRQQIEEARAELQRLRDELGSGN